MILTPHKYVGQFNISIININIYVCNFSPRLKWHSNNHQAYTDTQLNKVIYLYELKGK